MTRMGAKCRSGYAWGRARGIALALTALLAGSAVAGELETTPLPLPREQDTPAAAGLPPPQLQQILDRIAETSFDTPDSWEAELRLRRGALGPAPGLVVRGTALLCGGTGNCQTWLFRFADYVFDGKAYHRGRC
jgi:hypothetical protein